MKRLAIVAAAAVLMLAACKAKEANTMSSDTGSAMAPAPADTGMAMMKDSGMMQPTKDTTK